MGTDGLLGFIIGGQRYGSHNNMDSNPEYLGKDIVNFIISLEPEDYTTMARLVSEIAWVASKPPPSAELQERYQRFGFANLRVSSKIPENWYCLLRNVQGAAALPAIQSGKLKHMLRESSHGAWAYYIDFESRMLETWGGEDTRLDRVTFENMIMDGADEYVARVNRNLAKVTEDDEEEEEEQEEDSEEEEGEEGEGGEEN